MCRRGAEDIAEAGLAGFRVGSDLVAVLLAIGEAGVRVAGAAVLGASGAGQVGHELCLARLVEIQPVAGEIRGVSQRLPGQRDRCVARVGRQQCRHTHGASAAGIAPGCRGHDVRLCHAGVEPGFEQVHAFVGEKRVAAIVGQRQELDVFPTRRLVHELDVGRLRAGRRAQGDFIEIVVGPPGRAAELVGRHRQRIANAREVVAHAVGRNPVVLDDRVVDHEMEGLVVFRVAGAGPQAVDLCELAEQARGLTRYPVIAQRQISRPAEGDQLPGPLPREAHVGFVNLRVGAFEIEKTPNSHTVGGRPDLAVFAILAQ